MSEPREGGSDAETRGGVGLTEENTFPIQRVGREVGRELDPGTFVGPSGERSRDLEGISSPGPPLPPRSERQGWGLSEDHQAGARSPAQAVPSASQLEGWGFAKGDAGQEHKRARRKRCTLGSGPAREGAEERRAAAGTSRQRERILYGPSLGAVTLEPGHLLAQTLHPTMRTEVPSGAASAWLVVGADGKQAGRALLQTAAPSVAPAFPASAPPSPGDGSLPVQVFPLLLPKIMILFYFSKYVSWLYSRNFKC